MHFNEHFRIKGQHAFLSASQYHWMNYTEEKVVARYRNYKAAARGVELHDFAHQAIDLGIPLRGSKQTLVAYVNDGIKYGMTTEQMLYYSDNAFGTADTISFRRDLLRIHDLKTGVTAASMNQPKVYAAFFCLEYDYAPEEIDMELRIYQSDQVLIEEPDPLEIQDIMDKIRLFDLLIEREKEAGEF